MIERKEDILATDYVLNVISRQDWIDEEILMMYEECYRIAKKIFQEYGEDTTTLDKVRNEIMGLYGQI